MSRVVWDQLGHPDALPEVYVPCRSILCTCVRTPTASQLVDSHLWPEGSGLTEVDWACHLDVGNKLLQTDVFDCRRRLYYIRNQFDSLNINLWHLRCCKGCLTAGCKPLRCYDCLGCLYQEPWHILNNIRCLCVGNWIEPFFLTKTVVCPFCW